jgi:hypothetical protein
MPLSNSDYEYDSASETESTSDSETEMINIDSLKKLISIKDNNIVLNNDFTKLDKPLKIISFLGNARIGKSTLLNCYVSNKIKKNTKIFNTSKSLEQHCTSGIDMLCLEMSNYNLILLDVQGLDLNDSKDDCKLMLFIYMISNLIIFNPKTILDNTVLSSLQSLTSIITYIPDIESKTIKPSLLFRPRDIDQESDYNPVKNLKDMLSDVSDQYSNVRESIKKLFTNIECKPTFYLDKKEKSLLSKDNFIDFMDESSNGFQDFCSYLDIMIENISERPSDNFNERVKDLISKINSNKNIDYTKFDITMREAECDIKEWIFNELDKTKYDIPMETDGTQENYDIIIKPRIDYRDLILSEFDKRFDKTTPKIRDKFRKEILMTFNKHIDKVYNESVKISTNELNIIYDTKVKSFNKNTDFIDVDKPINEQVEYIYEEIRDFIRKTNYLDTMKNLFLDKTNNYIYEIDKEVNKIYKSILEEFYNYIDKQVLNIIAFMNHQVTLLLNTHINDIKQSFKMIINNIDKISKSEIFDKIWLYKSEIEIKHEPDIVFLVLNENKTYELVQIIFNDTKLNEYKTDDTQLLIDIVENYLYKFEDEFNKLRQDRLPLILDELQKETKLILPDNYLVIKEHYLNNKKLFNELKCNNIKTLNIFEHIIAYSINNRLVYNRLVSSKYAFIVDKLDIHRIYVQKDFDEKYKDILPYLNQMSDDIYLNYNITLVILDLLFNKALLINY